MNSKRYVVSEPGQVACHSRELASSPDRVQAEFARVTAAMADRGYTPSVIF